MSSEVGPKSSIDENKTTSDTGSAWVDRDGRNMHRLVWNYSQHINKPLVYGAAQNVLKGHLAAAGITSLQLNKLALPKQPVPDLDKTAQLYLRSLQPLLNKAEYESSEKALNEFIKKGGVGRELYRKLQERYRRTENWMSDWWLEAAYLGYRYPVIVHSSPGTVGPRQSFDSRESTYRYAAHLIGAVVNYNNMIKSCNLKQEMIKDAPLDMQPYAMILGTHRQPGRRVDKLLHVDDSNHLVIISNNHFFKLSLPSEVKEEQLVGTIKDVAERSRVAGKAVGILTGNHRDVWVEDHERLKSLGGNAKILKDIETSLFVLCLDKELPREMFQGKNDESVRGLQSLTGCSSNINSANRWHDKTVQLILSYDGFVGMEYEHTPCEGLPISVLTDHVVNYVQNKLGKNLQASSDFPEAEHLEFSLDASLEKSIDSAALSVDQLSRDIELDCFNFSDFGSQEIKRCKMSPDSFIQVAMQLSYYRLHKRPPAHYESAALRRFSAGRTECIRSTCNESVHFAQMMVAEEGVAAAAVEERKAAMLAAVDAHKRLATEATLGQGVDRLFFGLRMLAREEGLELPAFFSDTGYTRSCHFTLTSSQVAYKTASFMCYGPVTPDGYGCCYNPRPNDIFIACSAFNGCPETSAKRFAEAMRQSLRDMRKLAQA